MSDLAVTDEDFPPLPDGRAARVEAIENLMLALRWERGKTGPRLAAAWGLTLSAVESYSSEASRGIARNMDPKAMLAKLSTVLDRSVERAFTAGDMRAVATLAKTHAEMVGIIQAAKVQVNVLQDPKVTEFIDGMLLFFEALCPEYGETFDAWLAAADKDVDGARTDPASWLARRRACIDVESEGRPHV